MNPRISVVIMAFNEAESLEAVTREINAVLLNLGKTYEIVIVDDGSTDGTKKIADQLANELRGVRILQHQTNKGVGEVYRTGFAHAKGDFITFFPADGQFSADIIGQFVSAMDKADMVLGYLPDNTRSRVARFLSGIEKLLFTLLFGPVPKFQGVMMFRKELLSKLKLKSPGERGWAVLMELIIKAERNGYRIVNIPTRLRPRMYGKSKVNNLATVWANLTQAISLRFYF